MFYYKELKERDSCTKIQISCISRNFPFSKIKGKPPYSLRKDYFLK